MPLLEGDPAVADANIVSCPIAPFLLNLRGWCVLTSPLRVAAANFLWKGSP
jgi:hypothetical protein